MPPKPKFTKEEIIAAALKLVSKEGIEGLTARELGNALGSSARPIFTVFNSMEELQEEVQKAAMARFEEYGKENDSEMPFFKQVGMKMVLFGAEEPKLYQLLFMREDQKDSSFEGVFQHLGETAKRCIEAIQNDYGLNPQEAGCLFEHVWIYTFGVGAMCATGVFCYSKEQVGQMLSTQFQAMMMLVKSGKGPA